MKPSVRERRTSAPCSKRVKSRHDALKWFSTIVMSALCQKRTFNMLREQIYFAGLDHRFSPGAAWTIH